MSMSMSVILLLLRIQLNHGINPHNRNASLDRTLELLDLAHARLQDTSLDRVGNLALHQVEAVVLVRLLLSDGLFVLVGVAFLNSLREGVTDAELRDKLGGVLGCVDGEGLGDDEERLCEFTDCELFPGSLWNVSLGAQLSSTRKSYLLL